MKRTAGFTLIEVLVALTIVAVGLAAVLVSASQSSSASGAMRDKTIGSLVARNVIVEYQTREGWPEAGRSDGADAQAGADWPWEATVSETGDEYIRRLDVRVFRPARGEGSERGNPVMSLSAFLPSPEKADKPLGSGAAGGNPAS